MSARTDRKWTMKMSLTVLPIVMVMIFLFFLLTSSSIISMTKKNMMLYTDNCQYQLYSWTDNVIRELNIYKNIIETNFNDDDEKLDEFVKTTYMVNKAYPMGIYIGDDTGFYSDASGWIPGDDWVLVERPWYKCGKESTEFKFCNPYIDSQQNIMCVSVSARLEHDGCVRVMTADIFLDYAQELVNRISYENTIDGAMFVTGDDQFILVDSDGDMSGKQLRSGDSLHLKISELLKKGTIGQKEIKADGVKYYITIEKMKNTEWYMISYVKKRTILGYLYKIEFLMALVAVIATIVLSTVTTIYARQMNTMQKKAKTDKLTGLLNREGFESIVKESLAENSGRGALIMLDMDNFKSVNDTLGHPEGDKVLIECADLLETFFNRKTDAVCRLGGDEFAVFIGGEIGIYSLKSMLVRFRQQMKDYYKKEYAEFKLSSSIGAAFVKPDMTFMELYKQADETLYEVKKNGKDSFKIQNDAGEKEEADQ